jgi:hypothetical protein
VWVAAESEEGLRLLWAKQGGRQAALRFGNLTSVAPDNATLFLDTTAASSAFETAISLCSGAPTVLSIPNRADPGEMRGPNASMTLTTSWPATGHDSRCISTLSSRHIDAAAPDSTLVARLDPRPDAGRLHKRVLPAPDTLCAVARRGALP